MRIRTLTALGALAAALLLPTTATAATVAPVIPKATNIVKVLAPTIATTLPGAGKKVQSISPVEHWGGPTQLRVISAKVLEDGRTAYRVYLNKRPNQSTGWVMSDRVNLLRTTYFVVIDLSDRRVLVYGNGKLVRSIGAVVGAPETPTPTGEFFLSERVERANPNEFTGSWILPIGYSSVLEQFAGGPGRVAIHGRGGSSLDTPLGTAASHGCIRIDNAQVEWLAAKLPEGTPIRVRD